MIEFYTDHGTTRYLDIRVRGRICKYFDPWQPLDLQLCGVEILKDPRGCEIKREHKSLYDEVIQRATENMYMSAKHVVFGGIPEFIWPDMCQDAGYYLDDYRPLALFIFWHRQRIQWSDRMFTGSYHTLRAVFRHMRPHRES